MKKRRRGDIKMVGGLLKGKRYGREMEDGNLAAIRFVRSLRMVFEGSHNAALLKKLVKISIFGFARCSLAP